MFAPETPGPPPSLAPWPWARSGDAQDLAGLEDHQVHVTQVVEGGDLLHEAGQVPAGRQEALGDIVKGIALLNRVLTAGGGRAGGPGRGGGGPARRACRDQARRRRQLGGLRLLG